MNNEWPAEISVLVDQRNVVLAALLADPPTDGAPTMLSINPGPGQTVQTISITEDVPALLARLVTGSPQMLVLHGDRFGLVPAETTTQQ